MAQTGSACTKYMGCGCGGVVVQSLSLYGLQFSEYGFEAFSRSNAAMMEAE
jgi:hypothetical protein